MIIKKSKNGSKSKILPDIFQKRDFFSRLGTPRALRLTVVVSIENEHRSTQSLSCYWCHKMKKYQREFSISKKQNSEMSLLCPWTLPRLGKLTE